MTGKIVPGGRAVPRGRMDKRHAILRAAFTAFARDGYAQTSVDVIAAEAEVAKHTVYNHFGDKQSLLRETIAAEAERVLRKNLDAIDLLRADTGELRERLEEAGLRLLRCYTDARATAMRRLVYAEMSRDAHLLDIVQERAAKPAVEALADRLARLALAGRLSLSRPDEAAEQLRSLLVGPMETRSAMGSREVPEEELREVARAAVRVFLRVYGPEAAPTP
ncbi:TetR/AcrR family transcriptional regulator [Nonomuraea sp. NPDC050783]|uniref:TetR/AcrR family transcriptional regulator n=1 Tax=Nonomuraea sp. NPDC050783 TaxID=3154634 RepID=UPI0034676DC2